MTQIAILKRVRQIAFLKDIWFNIFDVENQWIRNGETSASRIESVDGWNIMLVQSDLGVLHLLLIFSFIDYDSLTYYKAP